MKTVTIKIEATSGLQVKRGDRVKKGDKIGIDFDFKHWVTSPISGRIKDILFDADEHSFVIEIIPKD